MKNNFSKQQRKAWNFWKNAENAYYSNGTNKKDNHHSNDW
jgi:hypothetical protein